jgi:O-antigen/teichoic acid export membrane protein
MQAALARYTLMLSALATVWLNGRHLGTEGLGTIALLSTGILLQVIISGCAAGGALVYLVPRMPMPKLMAAATLWIALSTLAAAAVMMVTGFVPGEWLAHALILGWMQSCFFFLQQLMLGRERVQHYNALIAIQPVSLLVFQLFFFVVFHDASVMSFVICLYLSFFLTLFMAIRRWGSRDFTWQFTGLSHSLKEVLALGWKAQAGNLFHLYNLRGPSVLLDKLVPQARSSVGVLALGLYAAEAIWNVAKSMSTVQYARIANMGNPHEMRALTRYYLKRALIFTTGATAVLVCIPESWFAAILGNQVSGLQQTLWWLAPGMVANGVSIILAHYFSGKGDYRRTLRASMFGAIPAACAGIGLVPVFGLSAAAAALSLALVVQALCLIGWYRRESLPAH